MVLIGIDAHKRSHTAVVVDEHGRQLAATSCGTSSAEHLRLVAFAAGYDAERRWAVEDCRHSSRRLERDLLLAGERIVRVPPKLMAHARDGARTYGKSLLEPPALARAPGCGAGAGAGTGRSARARAHCPLSAADAADRAARP